MTENNEKPTSPTDGIEETAVEPQAILAQVAIMPDGQLSLQLAEQITDRVLFCTEAARLFVMLAQRFHKMRSQIQVAKPGTRIARVH